MKSKIRAKLLALVLCLCLFGGCWDKQELEDHTFVIMLGLDKAEGDQILVSVAYPVTQTNIGGAESQGDYAVVSAKASTVAGAMSLFGITLAGPLSLFSTKTLVISEELARDDALRHIFSSGRYEQMRNNTNVLISKTGAAEFIAARVENPAIDPLRQEDLLLEQANFSAYYRPMQLLDFMMSLQAKDMDAAAMYGGVAIKAKEEAGQNSGEGGGNQGGSEQDPAGQAQSQEPVSRGYLPGRAPLTGQNHTQVSGLAIFSGQKMVGALDSFETQTLAMLTKSKTKKILNLPDPNSPDDTITVSIMPTKRGRTRAYLVGDTPTFEIDVHLRGNIEHIRAGAGYNQDALTEYVRRECLRNMEVLVDALQNQYRADLLGLGNRLARNFRTVQEWEAYGWRERYPDADIRINLTLRMENTGL
ncbi:MAG: Ger(x)C family spore germination protein [Oscillospiraceae bacterium]|nr:Ger(x)C family spore germination protein [Oscillospiraceae bacterium]